MRKILLCLVLLLAVPIPGKASVKPRLVSTNQTTSVTITPAEDKFWEDYDFSAPPKDSPNMGAWCSGLIDVLRANLVRYKVAIKIIESAAPAEDVFYLTGEDFDVAKNTIELVKTKVVRDHANAVKALALAEQYMYKTDSHSAWNIAAAQIDLASEYEQLEIRINPYAAAVFGRT